MSGEVKAKRSPLELESSEIRFDALLGHKHLTEAETKLIKRHPGQDNHVLLNPLLRWRLFWDIFVSVMLFYNGVAIPVSVAYAVVESYTNPIFWINRFVDICFIVDIGLNFETGIYAGEEIVMDRTRVRRMYLFSWFANDCIAAIPYDIIVILSASPGLSLNFVGGVIYGSLHVVQLLKLIRLLRLFKTIRLLTIFEKALVFRYEDIALAKFTLFVFFCLHWSACIFSWLDENTCGDSPEDSIFINADLANSRIGPRYFAAYYWALATMTTIGYGDISARCNSTRMFSLIVMLVASAVYAYGLSYVMDVIRRNNKHKSEFRELMDMANKYMDFRKIPSDLREDMRKFFNFMSESDTRRNELLSERIILNQLSPELRFAVLKHVNSGLLERVKLFQDIQETIGEVSILQEAVLHMQYQVFSPEETVIKEGSVSDELFFITKGTCILVKWGRITVKVLSEGSYYGELGFLAASEEFLRASSIKQVPVAATSKLKQQSVLGASFKGLLGGIEGGSESSLMNRSFNAKSFRGTAIDSIPEGGGGTLTRPSLGQTPTANPELAHNKSENTTATTNVSGKSSNSLNEEYLQDKSFVTQSYVDLRYITGETFFEIISMLPRAKLERVLGLMVKRSVDLRAQEALEEEELMKTYPEAHEEYMFGDDVSEEEASDWRKLDNDILDATLGGGVGMIPMETDISRTAGGNGILRRVLSRKLSSSTGGGLSTISPQPFTPRPGASRPKRRGSISQNKTGTRVLHHRTSISELKSRGVVCPPSPASQLFHKIVPSSTGARNIGFFRQRSHMRSQESINDEMTGGSGGSRPHRSSVPSTPTTRRNTQGRTKEDRRKDRRSTDPLGRRSAGGLGDDTPKRVVQDIEELMEQLGHIKRRLSMHMGTDDVKNTLMDKNTVSFSTADSMNTTPTRSPRRGAPFTSVLEGLDSSSHSDSSDYGEVVPVKSEWSGSVVDYDDSAIFKAPSEEEILLQLPAKRGGGSFTNRSLTVDTDGSAGDTEGAEEKRAQVEKNLFALAETFDEKSSPGIVRQRTEDSISGDGYAQAASDSKGAGSRQSSGRGGKLSSSPYSNQSASTTNFI